MTKFVHIVYVHPVELGEPNLHKVKAEREFNTKEQADEWIHFYNLGDDERHIPRATKAVYYGGVNDETGELV